MKQSYIIALLSTICAALLITTLYSFSSHIPTTCPRDVHFRVNPLFGTSSEVQIIEADSAYRCGDYIKLDDGGTATILERVN